MEKIAVEQKLFYQHSKTPLCSLDKGALTGLRHRTVIDYQTGAASLALWQEEHLPGFSVPLHLHDCEEIISVWQGEIEAYVGKHIFTVKREESFLIPAWEPHGFKVISSVPVKLLAIFSSANPNIFRMDGSQSKPPWEGGMPNHLQSSMDCS